MHRSQCRKAPFSAIAIRKTKQKTLSLSFRWLSNLAAPRSIVVWASCPHPCILPSILLLCSQSTSSCIHHHSTSHQLPFSILHPQNKEKHTLKNKSNKMGFWITHLLAKSGRPCLLEERQWEENPSRFGQQCRFWQLGICKGCQACRVLCG